jgi:RNA polymerase sigma-70 factor (ECF subfamily)
MDGAMTSAQQGKCVDTCSTPDDEALRRCQAGDIAGLDALVARHQLAALRIAYLLMQDRSLAEDIVQESFLLAYRHAGQFRSGTPFAPWFHRIVLNAARQHLRAATRRRETSLDLLDPRSPQRLPVVSDPLRHAERAEVRAAVTHVLRLLTHKQREVLVLRYYGGYKDNEIARALGLPAGTVRWRLHAALRAFDRQARSTYPWLLEDGRAPAAILEHSEGAADI